MISTARRVAVADLEQPVVQVLLVGGERASGRPGCAHDGQQQVDERDRPARRTAAAARAGTGKVDPAGRFE
jgi:hypothetical protein